MPAYAIAPTHAFLMHAGSAAVDMMLREQSASSLSSLPGYVQSLVSSKSGGLATT